MSNYACHSNPSTTQAHLLAGLLAAGMLLTIGITNSVSAAIFACETGQSVVYQDRPCPLKKAVKTDKKTTLGNPLSIHESWLVIPEQTAERAFCDKHGCECGNHQIKHSGSLAQAVADALYLDGSWHRYNSSRQAWLEAPSSSAQSHVHRDQMEEAACDVMMSQTILKQYADAVIHRLKKQVLEAEERGFDVETPCLQGSPQACALFQSVQMYKQLQIDAKALKRERTNEPILGAALVLTPESLTPEAFEEDGR